MCRPAADISRPRRRTANHRDPRQTIGCSKELVAILTHPSDLETLCTERGGGLDGRGPLPTDKTAVSRESHQQLLFPLMTASSQPQPSPICHPERSRGICSSTTYPGNVFERARHGTSSLSSVPRLFCRLLSPDLNLSGQDRFRTNGYLAGLRPLMS